MQVNPAIAIPLPVFEVWTNIRAEQVGDKSKDPIARFDTPDEVNSFLNIFAARGYNQLDTARTYSPMAPGSSEPRLAAVGAGDRFIIDTKVASSEPGSHTKEKVLKSINLSYDALKIKQINIEYLHKPDRDTPFEEACEAMDQSYKEGKFKKWGLSNYRADEVQKIIDICEEHGWVKPTAYQGQYNAVVRGGEKELFPVLRKHGIAFYAFSPAAGGIFAGRHKNVKAGDRYDKSHYIGSIYSNFYLKPSILAAVDNAVAVAAKNGISGHAASLRWTAYHSVLKKEHDDAVIIGASSLEQLTANIDTVEAGPLPDDVVAAFENVYAQIGEEEEIAYYM
ncbi:Aldo/keto reductase [Hypoxylon sp. FL1857]|nr:Aldo/keto reductase [Hypoxylon sp. FL1857]